MTKKQLLARIEALEAEIVRLQKKPSSVVVTGVSRPAWVRWSSQPVVTWSGANDTGPPTGGTRV